MSPTPTPAPLPPKLVVTKAATDTNLFVPGTMLVGLLVAAALNRSVRFISVYRTAAYITMAVSTISEGIIFLWLTDRDYGLVNAGLNAVAPSRSSPRRLRRSTSSSR